MEDPEHTTRMGSLRRDLEEERAMRSTLQERVAELEGQLEALQTNPTDGEEQNITIENQENQQVTTVGGTHAPSEEEGLPHLTTLYGTALQDSKNIQKVSLEKPEKFTGLEIDENPYALTYWYRDVVCWRQAYALDRPKERLVLAISQALGGTAKSMVQNLIMRDPGALKSVEELYAYLRRTFQNQDPGPEAWREFHTTRMRRGENALQFLNRLVQLTFVVNASTSPVCRTLTENDISARLQHGLRAYLQRALYNVRPPVEKVPLGRSHSKTSFDTEHDAIITRAVPRLPMRFTSPFFAKLSCWNPNVRSNERMRELLPALLSPWRHARSHPKAHRVSFMDRWRKNQY